MANVRVGLDSNVFCRGVLADWGAAKGVLIMAATRIFDLVVIQPVIDEVENTLRPRGTAWEDFCNLLRRCRTETIAPPTPAELTASRSLLVHLRHLNDLPVLVAAVKAGPDWFISDNVAHFGPEVANATGLNILTSYEFLRRFTPPRP